MAKKKPNVHTRMHVTAEEYTGHVIYDQHGRPLLRLGETVREGTRDGADITETITEHVKTRAGDVFDGSSLAPSRGQAGSKVCAVCERRPWLSLFRRRQPEINLTPAAEMKKCCYCGDNLCVKHYRVSRYDGQARCRWWCHKGHWLYNNVIFIH